MNKVLALLTAIAVMVPIMALGQSQMTMHKPPHVVKSHHHISAKMQAKIARRRHRLSHHTRDVKIEHAKFQAKMKAKIARKMHRKAVHNMHKHKP
jgi:hypothetical protein